jgi:hypothetical protein
MRGSSGAYDIAKIDDERPWVCGTPARDFAVLAAQSEIERRGNRRGDRGLFIGTGESLKRLGVKA